MPSLGAADENRDVGQVTSSTTEAILVKWQGIIDENARVEKVVSGFQFLEGPLWHPEGFLLFSDIPANTIYQWQPNQNIQVFRRPAGNANGNDS